MHLTTKLEIMNKFLHKKSLGFIFFLLFFLSYLFSLVLIYDIEHTSGVSESYLIENFSNRIPNFNSCNLDYYSTSTHINDGGFTKVRYRKIITKEERCLGKILYSSVDLGKDFKDIDKNQYIEFGVGQKLGFNLWLYETKTLMFLFCILLIAIFQIFLQKRNLFIFFVLSVFLISLLSFNEQNMYINSKNKMLPNIDTSNENLMIDLVKNDN